MNLPAFSSDPPLISSKPSLSPRRFKPNIVYQCRSRTDVVVLPPPSAPPDLVLDPNPVPTCLSTRITRPPDRYGFSHTSLLATLSSIVIPNSYSQAVKHEYWQKAMIEELDSGKSKMGCCPMSSHG